jgi:AcrR family transcriptional regulator
VTRRYESSLRAAQSEQTRRSLLEAAAALLEEGGIEVLTLPEVARRAGVTAPTAYRYFPKLEDLLAAVLDWLRPRIGMEQDRLLDTDFTALHQLPVDNFPRFEAHARVLEAVMDSPTWNRIRIASVKDRSIRAAEALGRARPDASQRSRRLAAAATYVLASPAAWRWMRETWGLDPDEARDAAAWGMRSLIDAFMAGADEMLAPRSAERALQPRRTSKKKKAKAR